MFCLTVETDSAWAHEAVRDLDDVLVDHAHCEMKAATNALSLVVRYPGDLALVRALVGLSLEELDHFRRVVSFLERRGLALGAPPVDGYAVELRTAMASLPPWSMPPIVDRLLVAALIEARSSERFKLLIAAFPEGTPQDLRVFYEELFAYEARHYRSYVDLAVQAARAGAPQMDARDVQSAVERRLALLADAEGAIVRSRADRDRRATVHG